jgi:cytochrome b561
MLINNTSNRYGIVAIVFHWVMSIIIIGMLALGLYMVGLKLGPTKVSLYGLHKSFGILVLMLVMMRLGWRLGGTTPILPFGMPEWQKLAARGSHWALYGFMFAMPITGWLLTSAAGLQPSFFGIFLLPPLVAPSHTQLVLFASVHKWLAYGLIATICVHVGAALHHHFIQKDLILQRMIDFSARLEDPRNG